MINLSSVASLPKFLSTTGSPLTLTPNYAQVICKRLDFLPSLIDALASVVQRIQGGGREGGSVETIVSDRTEHRGRLNYHLIVQEKTLVEPIERKVFLLKKKKYLL